MGHERVFGRYTLLLLLACIGINLLGSRLALACGLPLFLDCIGTILGAVLGGYFVAVSAGFFYNVLASIRDPVTLYYGLLNIGIGALSAYFARRGWFGKFSSALCCALPLAAIGGILGSLMTWGLYGLHIGEGVSAPYALALNSMTELGPFYSQLLADICVDLEDKFVSVSLAVALIKILPKKLLHRFLTYVVGSENPGSGTATGQKTKKSFLLGQRLGALIVLTAVCIGVSATMLSYVVYKAVNEQRYLELTDTSVDFVLSELNGDAINGYLEKGEPTSEYLAVKKRLDRILTKVPKLKFIYVYQIRSDGCHVVFDLDVPGIPGNRLGEVLPFDEDFRKYIPALLEGREIPPVISQGQFGYLLTRYKPVRDSNGRCVAYAAADVSIEEMRGNLCSFFIRMFSLLFGVGIVIMSFAFWYTQKKIVMPINALAGATSKFAYDSEEDRAKNSRRLNNLSIQTGDEIEDLYRALSKTTKDVSAYIRLIGKKNREMQEKAELITSMQDNIILSFANMVEFRDENTGYHIRNTAAYVGLLADALACDSCYRDILSPAYRANVVKSAPLHDVGKIKISDTILNKPGKLTREEFEIMKYHTTAGGQILKEAMGHITQDGYLSEAINMATYHHERWDGTGYPQGLAGTAIPLSARIMAVADVFDALVSRRSYKEPFPFEKALEIIKGESGTHFDPVLVSVFLALAPSLHKVLTEQKHLKA